MFLRPLIVAVSLLVVSSLAGAEPLDIDDQTRAIAQELRCVVCQNLSVADSPSEMAQQMRGIIREQLAAGKTPDQIKEFLNHGYE
jgi:cytochrome c-type biogenesis protein CcmH